jgi:serine/threonine-protein kinase
VALKFLPPELTSDKEAKTRFIREARAASVLEHHNICTIHEIDETPDSQVFISMAYYEGKTLQERLTEGNVSQNEACEIALHIIHGLMQAHAAGVIHRDLKPSNIMLTNSGEVRILDFGLAKFAGQTTLTKPDTTPGTVPYMSPEQIKGGKIDFRCDIWSLGVILYEMLGGQLPFPGEYDQVVIYSILNEKPTPLSVLNKNILEKLERIVNKCLLKNPEDRFRNIQELHSEMEMAASTLMAEVGHRPSMKHKIFSRQKIGYYLFLVGMLLILIFFTDWNAMKRVIVFQKLPLEKHLAILPITTPDQQAIAQSYLDGLVEIVCSRLTQLDEKSGKIWIVPFNEICGENISSVVDARKGFGVNLAITAHCMQEKDELQFVFNLIDTKKIRQIRSAIVEGEMSDNIALQEQILTKLSEMLDIKVNQSADRKWYGEKQLNPTAYDYYIRGLGYLQKSDIPENLNSAIELFRKSMEVDPDFPLVHARLGEAYWQKYQTTKDAQWVPFAESHCNKALQLDSTIPAVLVTEGNILLGTGKTKEAVVSFNRSLELDSTYGDAFRGLGKAYQMLGNFREAEKSHLKSIQFQPAFWRNYNSLGVFYYRRGRYQDAIVQFQKVIELIPESDKGYFNLGGIYFLLQDWDNARKTFQAALQIHPSEKAYSNLGTLNFYLGDYKSSALMYEKALTYSEYDYRIWAGLAEAYRWQGTKDEKYRNCYRRAIQCAQEQLAVNPKNLEIMADLSGFYASIGNVKDAENLLQKLISEHPDNVETYFRIGETCEMLGQRSQALIWIEKALKAGFSKALIEVYPGLRNLREDPGFQHIITGS